METAPDPDLAAARLSTLDTLRRRGIRAWAVIGWGAIAMLLVANAAFGAGVGMVLLVIGTLINIGPTYVAVRGRYDAQARMLMGTLAAIIPAMLVFLLQGHPWQMDGHMYFFVGMAALVMLGDWRPIAIATVLTAFHHTMFEWLAPTWVFEGPGAMGRVAFHVVAVGLQFSLLAFLTVQLERLFDGQDAAIRHAGEMIDAAEASRRQTEAAMHLARTAEAEAERERRRREAAEGRATAERRGELLTLANEFERSVTSIVRAVARTSEQMEQSVRQLDTASAAADTEAGEVADVAARAAIEIAQVASTVRDLSRSVQTIAVAAGQQSDLTGTASAEAKRSVETALVLEQQAIEVQGFLADIRKIAAKTDLLALNATIEAARAGEAGRGFAVVAGEVKSLSADTTRASDRISVLIEGIRQGVADTGLKLRHVNGAIGQVASAATGIASAVDDQRASAQAVDGGAERAATTAHDIGRRIGRVATAAGVAANLSATVRTSASDLVTSARELRSSADLFVSFLHADDALTG